MEEKLLNHKNVFCGNVLDVCFDEVLLPNGKHSTREIVNHKGAACILALTDNNEIIFIKQFRYPFKKVLLELPAGKLDGDSPIECAKRELLEETGGVGKNFVSLGVMYPTVGYSNEIIHLFSCKIEKFELPCPDDDELLEVVQIPLSTAINMVLNDEINDAKTQIAILKYKEKIK